MKNLNLFVATRAPIGNPLLLLITISLSAYGFHAPAQDVVPLVNAHAHNDYLHDRPLLDALDHGFCSVEADIWLIDGQLLVAHDRDKVDPRRTLQGLYLDPLLERCRQNGGRVYPGGPEFILLIDIKSAGAATFEALRTVLSRYEEMLTTFTDGQLRKRAVRAIVSGSRPRALMESQTKHFAGYDGRLSDLESGASSAFMPLISSSWSSTFTWRGEGPMPQGEKDKLRAIVQKAHSENRLVRFWAIPENTNFYDELRAAQVDLINADNLPKLRDYLLEKDAGR